MDYRILPTEEVEELIKVVDAERMEAETEEAAKKATGSK